MKLSHPSPVPWKTPMELASPTLHRNGDGVKGKSIQRWDLLNVRDLAIEEYHLHVFVDVDLLCA